MTKCLHHFWNPPAPARDVRILLIVAHLPRSVVQWWLRQGHLGKAWDQDECWACDRANKGSDVTAAVYLGPEPVVGFGQYFSALPWKWSQRLPRPWLLPFV